MTSKRKTRKRGGAKGHKVAPASAVTVSAMPTQWDRGATGPANRVGLIEEDAAEIDPTTGKASNPNGVKRARRVDMLEVWHRKGEITTAGFNAAEKLRDAFENTQRAPGWPETERVQSSPKPDHAVTIQIDRMSNYHRFAILVAAEDWPIINACVLNRQLPSEVRIRGARPYWLAGYQDGMRALRNALDRLAAAMG
jgi:hypothetical protein